jgi:hypothetical protein
VLEPHYSNFKTHIVLKDFHGWNEYLRAAPRIAHRLCSSYEAIALLLSILARWSVQVKSGVAGGRGIRLGKGVTTLWLSSILTRLIHS